MNTVEGEVWGGGGVGDEWSSPYEVLRKKCGTVPLDAKTRIESGELLTMSGRELLALWHRAYNGTSTGPFYGIRGWYHDLYRDKLPSRVWIDVGAYRGEASRQAALDDSSLLVHAFEPIPVLFEELNRGPTNYHVYPMAVSDRDGMASFRINAFVAASSLLPLDEAARLAWIDGHLLVEEREILVSTVRLDTFMDGAGITEVEFLKVDAQGADFQVVSSAAKRLIDIRRIKLEVAITPRQLYLGAADKATVTAFLEAEGFRLIETERQSHNQGENLTFAR